jgi:hypothetical protein
MKTPLNNSQITNKPKEKTVLPLKNTWIKVF